MTTPYTEAGMNAVYTKVIAAIGKEQAILFNILNAPHAKIICGFGVAYAPVSISKSCYDLITRAGNAT